MNALKLALPLIVALVYSPAQGLAAPILSADLASFAVLAAAGVTNVPTSVIGGNLGSAPNASVGGGYIFTAGSLQPNTGLAQQAQLDLDDAIVDLSAFGPGLNIGASLDAFQALQGGSIGPGIYTVTASTSPNLAGALILDGDGDSDAVWVFQMESTLITSSISTVTVQNVGDGAQVGLYWNVPSAATIDGITFAGNVLAMGLISSDGGLTLGCGRLLSATAQVTLIQDRISLGCVDFEDSGGFDQGVDIGSGGEVVSGVPEPGTLLLFGFGLAGLCSFKKRLLPVA